MKKIYVTYEQTFYRTQELEIDDEDYEMLCNRRSRDHYDVITDIRKTLWNIDPSEKYSHSTLDIKQIEDDDEESLYDGD